MTQYKITASTEWSAYDSNTIMLELGYESTETSMMLSKNRN